MRANEAERSMRVFAEKVPPAVHATDPNFVEYESP
jgi:hypothetical protein